MCLNQEQNFKTATNVIFLKLQKLFKVHCIYVFHYYLQFQQTIESKKVQQQRIHRFIIDNHRLFNKKNFSKDQPSILQHATFLT